MSKKYDVTVAGDLMIDFTCTGQTAEGISVYERNLGGSPMNVTAQVVQLGGTASAIAAVGDDDHGRYLVSVLQKLGVDTSNVMFSDGWGTRMLFVYFLDGNDR